MEITSSEVYCLLVSIFDTYIIYRFMGIFFDRTDVNKRTEIISYIGYYFIISAIFLFINIPILLLICNIIVYLGLTYNYQASFKKRILVVLFIYFIMFCIESIIAATMLAGNLPSIFDINNIYSFWGITISRLFIYVAVLIINYFCSIKKEIIIPIRYWFQIFLIPLASFCAFLLLLQSYLKLWQMLTCLIMLLIINFSAIRLYDVIMGAFEDRHMQMLLSQQNEYYNNQFEIMKNSLKVRNAEKHDMKNHLCAIETLINMNEYGKAVEHISTMMDLCSATREHSVSGNIDIDSILNYKIQEAEQMGITVNLEISVPGNLNITSFDMAIILGNILDNAINATKKLEHNKKIDLSIKYNKGRIIIKISNPFDGEVLYHNGKIVTSSNDKDNHGIGLINVRKILEKYNGDMEIEHLDNTFSVILLMFV